MQSRNTNGPFYYFLQKRILCSLTKSKDEATVILWISSVISKFTLFHSFSINNLSPKNFCNPCYILFAYPPGYLLFNGTIQPFSSSTPFPLSHFLFLVFPLTSLTFRSYSPLSTCCPFSHTSFPFSHTSFPFFLFSILSYLLSTSSIAPPPLSPFFCSTCPLS